MMGSDDNGNNGNIQLGDIKHTNNYQNNHHKTTTTKISARDQHSELDSKPYFTESSSEGGSSIC